MKLISTKLLILAISLVFYSNLIAQNTAETFVYGDALPDAPELAPRGEYKIGVRTLDFVNKNQVDVLKSKGGVDPTYDRPTQSRSLVSSQCGGRCERFGNLRSSDGFFKRPQTPTYSIYIFRSCYA